MSHTYILVWLIIYDSLLHFWTEIALVLLTHFLCKLLYSSVEYRKLFRLICGCRNGTNLIPLYSLIRPEFIFGSVLKWKDLHQELTLRSKLICVIPENQHCLNHTNLLIKIKMKINYDFLDWHKLILISKWDLLMEVFPVSEVSSYWSLTTLYFIPSRTAD